MGRPAAVKLERSEREWGRAVSAHIEQHAGKMDVLFPVLLQELKGRLGLDAALCYGLTAPGDFVQLEFAHDIAVRGGGATILRRHLHGRFRPKWGYYNPVRPEPGQANRVLSVRDHLAPHRPMGEDMLEAVRDAGIAGMDQVRVLLCEGRALLAWFGGFRHDTVTARERAIFSTIVPALRSRLLLEERLQGAALKESAFDTVLEAINCAAILLGPTGAIATANAAGRALLEDDGRELRERLRYAAAGGEVPGVEVTPFPVPGSGRHLLALVRPPSQSDAPLRARLLGTRWGLTARHLDVLERLAWGDSNKAIASRIGCAERTVELHVAAIMGRVGVDSRAELIARFWTSPL